MSNKKLEDLEDFFSDHNGRIPIIGTGIVGSSLAAILSGSSKYVSVILLDRNISTEIPVGSSGLAPGFVGQLNELPVLTELAKRSVKHYLTLPDQRVFQQLGGLEIAFTSVGVKSLEKRLKLAQEAGLKAKIINDVEAIVKLAPHLINVQGVQTGNPKALYFEEDGKDPVIRTHIERENAEKSGAHLMDGDVEEIEMLGEGHYIAHVRIGKRGERTQIHAEKIVICTGLWARQLAAKELWPIVQVKHPYSYSAVRAPKVPSPFVRWPEVHVYARDHGDRDGVGSYEHTPIPILDEDELRGINGSLDKWPVEFDKVLEDAGSVLTTDVRITFEDSVNLQEKDPGSSGAYKFNGLFAVTPDGLPLVGTLGNGVYCAVGIWVTHAYGSARLIADVVLGEKKEEDEWIFKQLDPHRFGERTEELVQKAVGTYNDIYNRKQ
ncbi:nucleotide-binding domain-containing protein [Dendrothele bispora CBS 962.96]|uniref:Nucleotide-binding domain-containing protein n=1 Tax=Dendrothele bispora (strain CBS 962.96) TaxID=1314807 RepID=A0A4S8MYE2_DENBC|nr:nucleotide-binding domain-containing protein [Dendrothele bispora CBS 962.96]